MEVELRIAWRLLIHDASCWMNSQVLTFCLLIYRGMHVVMANRRFATKYYYFYFNTVFQHFAH